MTGPTLRLIARGAVVWRGHVLLAPSLIPGDPPGWQCPGGTIGLGERARDAVARGFIEEMGRRVDVLDALPVMEDIRDHQGEIRHEITLPFLAQWRDGYEPFDLSPIECFESDGTRFQARWVPLDDLSGGGLTVHPVGFAGLLIDHLSAPRAVDDAETPRATAPILRPLADGETRSGTQRAIALGHLIWRGHALLHPVGQPGGSAAWRSLGGGIAYGERAEDAVRREFLEETARAVDVVESRGVAENIFERAGAIGHELVFEYTLGWSPGHEPSDLADLDCAESGGDRFPAHWMPLEDVLGGSPTIYPDGFVDRLRGWLADGIDGAHR